MSDSLLIALQVLVYAAIGPLAIVLPSRRTGQSANVLTRPGTKAVAGVGAVRTATETVVMEVESVSGTRFVGRLSVSAVPSASSLRPGLVVLVTFDPVAREPRSLAGDIAAVSAEFDRMLIGKGLLTRDKLDLIRHGVRSHGVVTGVRATGNQREDHREVEIDLMVRRPGGGQFPAHERTLVPVSSLAEVTPGCVIDAYYRRDDESAVAVCVPPC